MRVAVRVFEDRPEATVFVKTLGKVGWAAKTYSRNSPPTGVPAHARHSTAEMVGVAKSHVDVNVA